MELNPLRLLCLIGFVPVALSNELLGPLLIQQQMTWSMAQNFCQENYVDLFSISNPSDQVKLIEEMKKKNEIGSVWMGLYIDLDSWYWTYNHLPLKNTSVQLWNSGHPNNAYGKNVCVAMYTAGYWANIPCSDVAPFVCYDASNSYATRFVAYTSRPSKTWLDAQTYCRQHHTDLATVMDQSDASLIIQLLKNLQRTCGWIGLTRDMWKWSDGSSTSSIPWLSGQPDNFNTWENCASVQNGLLSDEQCSIQHNFMCSAYIVRKQTVKLQVKSQNVLDFAVQSSILEMIKQKLQENGMSVNTTVTWRVQQDENIFYKKVNNNLQP